MKKTLISITLILISLTRMFPCGGGDWDYYNYRTLFSQELINSPRYYPFLFAYGGYHETDSIKVKNKNIEEWQKYLGINYEQAYYLVFKSSQEDLKDLLSDKKIKDKQLTFADAKFVKNKKEALEYLVIAKEFEPYMRITGSSYGWYYYEEIDDAEKIPYDKMTLQLQKTWKQVKDKELKLRYGYQMVRLAHYNRKYDEAIQFFGTYVEPLNLKSEMYYYALSQKAGAIRGNGDVITANSQFFEVFSSSSDLKTSALSSIRLNENVDYEQFLYTAKTTEEKNDADLLLGYITFSNPLASARKIIQRSPDAIQAKVLTARAISFIEGNMKMYGDIKKYSDKRFPIIDKDEEKTLKEALDFVTRQANSSNVKQKNYWNIASAYLNYIDRNYIGAKGYLSRVDVKEEGYLEQRDILAMLIDIGKETQITDEVEERIFAEYKDVFTSQYSHKGRAKIAGFVMDILSNRYYWQGDYAKSFLLRNDLYTLQDNPNLNLLNEIEDLYFKTDKNSFEKHLIANLEVGGYEDKDVPVLDFLRYMKGIVYLTNDNLEEAKAMFDKSDYSRTNLPSNIFGYNQIECFTCDENMKVDYLSEFSYIKDSLDERSLVTALIRLKDEAEEYNNNRSAKANYLLGNFYYNTSVTGYYRNYLRFGHTGDRKSVV